MSKVKQKYSLSVMIGRFQPPHDAHIDVIKKALSNSERLLIFLGSDDQPRTIKNPFTFIERSGMIVESLSIEYNSRIKFIPLKDCLYNDQEWISKIQDRVTQELLITNSEKENVVLYGYHKDETSYYLDMFPQWDYIEANCNKTLHSTDIRTRMFELGSSYNFNHEGSMLPIGTIKFLDNFIGSRTFNHLLNEYDTIRQYQIQWANSPYLPVFVTTDAVVIISGHILLVKRRSAPGKGLWALPGGFINQSEKLENCMIRELKEETKIKIPVAVLKGSIKKMKVFDEPKRSLRGRTITHAYLINLAPGNLPKIKGSSDTDKAKWVPLNAFKKMRHLMFDDHYDIINNMIGEV